jgi:hypothetical protein
MGTIFALPNCSKEFGDLNVTKNTFKEGLPKINFLSADKKCKEL